MRRDALAAVSGYSCRMSSRIYRPMTVSVTPSKTSWICRIKRSICFGTFAAGQRCVVHARTNEFSALSEVEVQQVENLYADSWQERREV
jgi:hypothetical protein